MVNKKHYTFTKQLHSIGRTGEIWVDTAQCTICGVIKRVIFSDASDGEYTVAGLCLDCVKRECEKTEEELSIPCTCENCLRVGKIDYYNKKHGSLFLP